MSCSSRRKGTGIVNDDFFKDFNMDDIDLSLENFEQLFRTGNLFENGDTRDADIKTHWTRNATRLVALAIAAGLGALTETLGTLVPMTEASGFDTAAATTAIGTVVSSFR
ncbi:unnamed protein product [Camellia sinensis]